MLRGKPAANATSVPISASTDIAAATLAVRTSLLGAEQREHADGGHLLRAVEQRQAFLGLKRQRHEAAPVERLRAVDDLAVDFGPARPINGSARCASGARSPDAPTDPCDGTTGWMPARRNSSSRSTISGRQPLWPCASALARSSSIARTTSVECGCADAHGVADEQVVLQRLACRACAMRCEARSPKPVVTP